MPEEKRPPMPTPFNEEDFLPKEPTQLFDDLYLVGNAVTGMLVLKTSEGLVVFDATEDTDAYDKYLEPMIKKFGFENEKVLMCLLTHGHFDHYLGSEQIRRRTGCDVAISFEDAAYTIWCMENVGPDGEFKSGVVPRITKILKDEEDLVFGDHTVHVMIGGGHTPGCLNYSFEVHEGNKTYRVVECGGFGIFGPGRYPDNDHVYPFGMQWAVDQALNFASSSVKLWEYCKRNNVTVYFNPHPQLCDAWNLVEKNKKRKDGDTNAFVIGLEGVRKYIASRYTSALESASAFSEIEKEYIG